MLARSTREGNFSGPDEETFLAGYDFTNRVRGALIKARDEAHHRNHQYVGTEHLLIGLLAEDDTLVMDILENLGANPIEIQTTVNHLAEDGPPSAKSRIADLPYTARARVVLDQAIGVAHEFGDGYVGTQHLLLGLVRERHGIAAKALAIAGVSEASLRREIVRLLQGEGVAAALEAEPAAPAEEKHVPLSVAVEIRYDDGTLTKKVFPSNDDAIVFLRERAEG